MSTFLSILKYVAPFIIQAISGYMALKGHQNVSMGTAGIGDTAVYGYGQAALGWIGVIGASGWHVWNLATASKAPAKAPSGVDEALHQLSIAHGMLVADSKATDLQIESVGTAIKERRKGLVSQ